jgi:hypothetical protein
MFYALPKSRNVLKFNSVNKHLNVILYVGMTAVNLNVIECLVVLTWQKTCKFSRNSDNLMK